MSVPAELVNVGTIAGDQTGDSGQVPFQKVNAGLTLLNAVLTGGTYKTSFQSGQIKYTGPNDTINTSPGLAFGLTVPNPTGIPTQALFVGSGVAQACIVTDVVNAGTPGINLLVVAGESASPSSDVGGNLSLYGGASNNGAAGRVLVQGGTSTGALGGQILIQGGNSTLGGAGSVVISGGVNGVAGGSITLESTTLNGVPGLVHIRNNSTDSVAFNGSGAWLLGGTSAGTSGQILASQGTSGPPAWQTLTAGTYAVITAETAAGVTITNTSIAPFDMRRYGSDPTGVADSSTAFQAMFSVLLNAGGGKGVIVPGTYLISSSLIKTIWPTSGPTAYLHGISIDARNVVINFTGTGYAIDLTAQGASATDGQPLFSLTGMNIICTSSASGGIRQTDIGAARYTDVFVFGATAGAGFTQRNLALFSENNHYTGCGAVNCQDGMAFVHSGGAISMARTQVDGMFMAGISRYWFNVGSGVSVYNSRFSKISGNFASLAYFGIGAPSAPADMTGTVIDGIDAEWDGTASGNQCLIRLNDYPVSAGTYRRPSVYNIGAYATYTGGTPIPIWGDSNGNALAGGPESGLTQGFAVNGGPLISTCGQSGVYEANYNAAAGRNIATNNSGAYTLTLTGLSSIATARATISRSGNICSLNSFDPLIGTSNATTYTFTGMPTEYSTATAISIPCLLTNNSVSDVPGFASINGTTITFYLATAFNTYSATGFTASGSKGLASTLVWAL